MLYNRINQSVFLFTQYQRLKFIRYCLVAMTACLLSISAMAATDSAHTTSVSAPMKIGIVGSGWLGGTIGKLLVNAGYDVMFSSQHLDTDQQLAKQLGHHAFAGTPQQAAQFGPVVILAVPYGAIPSLGKALDADLKGKIVLDGANPYEGRDGAVATEALQNGAGITTQKYFPGTHVVRVFNGVYASAIQASATRHADKLGIPIAGDDAHAVQVAAQIVSAIGSEPVIVGDLASAKSFQPGGAGFGANTTASALRSMLGLNK